MGKKVWAWGRRSGHGEEGLGMGKKVWLWGRRSGHGEEGLVMGKKVWLWGRRSGHGEEGLGISLHLNRSYRMQICMESGWVNQQPVTIPW